MNEGKKDRSKNGTEHFMHNFSDEADLHHVVTTANLTFLGRDDKTNLRQKNELS